MATPLLGWISPADRTQAQQDAHNRIMAAQPRFALVAPTVPKGTKVVLTDLWKNPTVMADTGMEFTGFHQLTGSCLPAGAPVRMADGSEKAIETVGVGDEVITHTGKARKVVRTFMRDFSGDMVTLHVGGFPFPLTVTADHQIAVSHGETIAWKRADEIGEGDQVLIQWSRPESRQASIDLADLLGDRAVVLDELMKENAYTKGEEPDVPVANITVARHVVRRSGIDWQGKIKLVRGRSENAMPRHLPVSPSLGRFVGLYLAEGGCDGCKVVFTFAADEESLCGEVLALARGIFGAEGETFISNERGTSRKVVFNNSTLAAVLKELMPGNVYTKRVPAIFFGADEETKTALILGWLHGDGYTGLKGKRGVEARIQGVTASAGLARDMVTLALSCGMRASATRRKPRKQSREAYDVYLGGKKALALFPALVEARQAIGVQRRSDTDQNRTRFGYARPVRRVVLQRVDVLPVYDFEVEEDHSFLSSDVVVHNCVGASAGNAIATLAFVQRLLSQGATKAFIPWWPFPYGRTRYNEGDRGPGEGAIDSVMGETLAKEGVYEITQAGLPPFQKDNGFYLTESLEMQWSDGGSIQQKWKDVAKQYPLGSYPALSSSNEVKASILAGKPVLDGCDNYVGNGTIKGNGQDAYVTGHYDGRGGHSTCFLGYWEHPNDGPLYLYSNQWPTSTYPKDPAGAGRCCVWLPESEVDKLFRTGGGDGETMALFHLQYTPAEPSILNWMNL